MCNLSVKLRPRLPNYRPTRQHQFSSKFDFSEPQKNQISRAAQPYLAGAGPYGGVWLVWFRVVWFPSRLIRGGPQEEERGSRHGHWRPATETEGRKNTFRVTCQITYLSGVTRRQLRQRRRQKAREDEWVGLGVHGRERSITAHVDPSYMCNDA